MMPKSVKIERVLVRSLSERGSMADTESLWDGRPTSPRIETRTQLLQ